MNIRHPVRAGMFYESSPTSCRKHAAKLLDAAEPPADGEAQRPQADRDVIDDLLTGDSDGKEA